MDGSRAGRPHALDALARRALDLLLAATLLLLLSPLLAIVALLVKLSSPGPVFHRGMRIGKGGVPFALLKFRSMVVGAELVGPAITVHGDSRVTRVGRFIRRTKIDELPQLWNVLTGSMSLVGPRPEAPHYVAMYTRQEREVLTVRPGITSAASISYWDEETLLHGRDWEDLYVNIVMREKLAIDLAYLRTRTVFKDVMILFRTFFASFKRDPKVIGDAPIDKNPLSKSHLVRKDE